MESGWLYYGVIPIFAAGVSLILAGIVSATDKEYKHALEQNGVLRPIAWIVILGVAILVISVIGRFLWSVA